MANETTRTLDTFNKPHGPGALAGDYSTQIGTITTEEREITDRSYECAAWFRTLRVPAGTYPVIMTATRRMYSGEVSTPQAWIKYEGEVINADLAGRWCGNRISGKDHGRDAIMGTVGSVTEGLTLYTVGERVPLSAEGMAIDWSKVERNEDGRILGAVRDVAEGLALELASGYVSHTGTVNGAVAIVYNRGSAGEFARIIAKVAPNKYRIASAQLPVQWHGPEAEARATAMAKAINAAGRIQAEHWHLTRSY